MYLTFKYQLLILDIYFMWIKYSYTICWIYIRTNFIPTIIILNHFNYCIPELGGWAINIQIYKINTIIPIS